jgi:uncharacterized protein
MHSLWESAVVGMLRRLADWVCRYPRLFFYPQAVLLVLSIGYTVAYLQFQSNRSDLVGEDKVYHRNFQEYKREFLAQEELVAVVESEDMEKNRQFVERLGARLLQETNLFTDVMFNNDVKMMGKKALTFFPEPKLEELRDTLHSYRPFLQQFSGATNLQSLFRMFNRQFRTAKREANEENKALVRAIPAVERIVQQALDTLDRPGTPPSPGLTVLFNAGREAEKQIYLTFAGGRIYLVMARACNPKLNPQAVQRLRVLVREIKREVPGVNAALTGEPVLEFDEMRQSQRDTTVATIVSLVLCALIFIYGYQESGRPIKATICLVVGLAYTMAYTTFWPGHLNILTITFLPMLVGLAVDFGVHLVTRFEEELRRGRSEREAMEKAIVFTGQGIFTGCFTTAGAFFAMGLTDFKGIKEMGMICGGGLLICLVPMMTLLPVLLLRGRQNVIDHQFRRDMEKRARIERLWLDRPILVIGVTAVLCLLALARFPRVYFDYNLLDLQSKGLPAVVFERKLIDSAEKSVLFCAVITPSLEEAVQLQARIAKLPAVATNYSMAPYLLEDQRRKLALIREIKQELTGIEFQKPDPGPVRVLELSATLYGTQGYLGWAAGEAEKTGDPELARQLLGLRQAIGELRKRMIADREVASVKLAAFQYALSRDLRDTFAALRGQDDREGLRIEDLPPALRHQFVSKSGRLYLIQVYPRKDVWQRQNQEEFVTQLRQELDPGNTGRPIITGTPVQLLEYTSLLKNSYQEAAWYALAAIALLVLVHFRSITSVLLALLPVAIGTIWMVGFMGWSNPVIPFNPANIMTLPLVIGIGVTSGIHILNRFAEEKNPGILAKSTGKAVLVSALTTMVGFGSLMLGRHQGIASLGYVMAVGTGTCMVAAVTALPAVLNLRARWQARAPRKKEPSDETTGSALGREEPR